MKKETVLTLLIAAAISFPTSSSARKITADEAAAAARGFLNRESLTKAAASDLVLLWDGGKVNARQRATGISAITDTGTAARNADGNAGGYITGNAAGSADGNAAENSHGNAAGSEAPFYVFSHGGGEGFVIVAGDDVLNPILAYSFDSRFPVDDIPENLLQWTGTCRKVVADARLGLLTQSAETAGKWAAVNAEAGSGGTISSVNLHSAEWSQRAPFNRYCPQIGADNSAVGCVALATAIVMKAHCWPSNPKGTIPAYTSGTTLNIPACTLDGVTYNWDNMPSDTDADSWTEEQKDEVARLCYHCGVMVQSQYGTSTSASVSDVRDGLISYMGYDANSSYTSRTGWKDEDWIAKITEEIDRGYPIIYRGTSSSESGHAFVVDGYDSQGYLHVNWGWGGRGNGFFLMHNMESYTESNCALFGLSSDTGVAPGPIFYTYNSEYEGCYGLLSDTPYVESGVEFTVRLSFTNKGSVSAPEGTTIYIRMVRPDGGIEDIGSFTTVLSGGGCYSTRTLKCTINGAIEKGCRIRAAYRNSTGKMVFIDGPFSSIPLAYDLLSETGVKYNSSTKLLTLNTLIGIEYSFSGEGKDLSGTVTSHAEGIDCGGCTGPYTLTLANGHETRSVRIIL